MTQYSILEPPCVIGLNHGRLNYTVLSVGTQSLALRLRDPCGKKMTTSIIIWSTKWERNSSPDFQRVKRAKRWLIRYQSREMRGPDLGQFDTTVACVSVWHSLSTNGLFWCRDTVLVQHIYSDTRNPDQRKSPIVSYKFHECIDDLSCNYKSKAKCRANYPQHL